MAVTYQATFKPRFSVVGDNGVGAEYQCVPGSPFPNQPVNMAAGTGSYQLNAATFVTTTVTSGNTRGIDLTTLVAFDGSAMTLATVKVLVAAVTANATTDTDPYFRMGPLGYTNGAVLGFGSTTGSIEVRSGGVEIQNPISGWAVTSGNKLLVLSAPGSYDVTANILICGKK